MSRNLMLMVMVAALIGVRPNVLFAQGQRPQLYTSKTFVVRTDLPPAEANQLMVNLESMMKLVSSYFGRPCRKPIRMFIVRDLSNWPAEEVQQFPETGRQHILENAGVTVTSVRGIVGGPKLDADAVVYAVPDHGIPQHEAIHAYCGITFGELGPVWYSEGMAEVGKYFRDRELGVSASKGVIAYLKSQSPKPLLEIVNNPLEQTGDSWQNYAWRWAICHLLGSNTNYAQRFKPLGLALLAGTDTSFQAVYGMQIPEIEFEYQLFLKDVEPGYRNDLCSWDWTTKFRQASPRSEVSSRVEAGRGWQASKAIVKAGETYQITTTGEWTLEKGAMPVSAAGDGQGRGELVGVIFDNYRLSEPFVIGGARTFRVPQDGKLFLRCRDDWGSVADNKGALVVKIIQVIPQPPSPNSADR